MTTGRLLLLASDDATVPKKSTTTQSRRSLLWEIIGVVFGGGLVVFIANLVYNDYLIEPALSFQIRKSTIHGYDCCYPNMNTTTEDFPWPNASHAATKPQVISNDIAIINNGRESATDLRITLVSNEMLYRLDKALSTEKIEPVAEGKHILTGEIMRLAPNAMAAIN